MIQKSLMLIDPTCDAHRPTGPDASKEGASLVETGRQRMHTPSTQVAVVIPVHNKISHLPRSLGSVLAQTRLPAEIIAIDDASTDASRTYLQQIDDPRFRLITHDHPRPLGPGGARNLGIKAARSEWIAFLDADDEWEPFFLEEAMSLIEGADAGLSVVFTGFVNQYSDVAKLHEYTAELMPAHKQRHSFESYLRAWLTVKRSPMHTSSTVVRRETLEKVGMFADGPLAKRGEDIDLWLRCLTYGDALASSRVCARYFRESENMVTRNTSTNATPIICGTIRKLLPKRNRAERRLLRRLNNHVIYHHARAAIRRERLKPDLLTGMFPLSSLGLTAAVMVLAIYSMGHKSA